MARPDFSGAIIEFQHRADLLLVNEHEAAQPLGSIDSTLDWEDTARGFRTL